MIDDTITQRELVEYERLKIQIGRQLERVKILEIESFLTGAGAQTKDFSTDAELVTS